jgi:predicted dehydrogenase
MDRRQFLTTGAAGLAARGYALPFADQKPRRVGLIGCGWYGKCDIFRLIQVAPVEVVSLCDVDKRMLAEAAELMSQRQASKKKPRTFTDYREMLAQKDLDIVEVATPDHWHALPMIEAVKNGADVYCQKPISVDVVEGQAMLAAARKYKRVVQIGTQRRSTPHLIEMRDRIINEGKLGTVGMVDIFSYSTRNAPNPPDTAPPDYLDYEFWTGPAPKRPFNPMTHPRSWRNFMEYGNGLTGDLGVHMLDLARWVLNLGWPRSISATGGILVQKAGKANIADTQIATFDFGGVKMTWTHRTYGGSPDPKYKWGCIFNGSGGTLKADLMGYDFIPIKGEPIHRDVTYELDQYPIDRDEKDLERHVAPAIRGHMKDFLHAIDNRSKPVADIEQGFISSSCCIMANVSMNLGRSIAYDPVKGTVPGDAEATRALKRPYRAPWVHPDPAKV